MFGHSGGFVILDEDISSIVMMLEVVSEDRDINQCFFDLVEMFALAISNAVYRSDYIAREQRYLKIINSYRTFEHRKMFPEMIARLGIALGKECRDVLGDVADIIGLTSIETGHYWSPWDLCVKMAREKFKNTRERLSIAAAIEQYGYISVNEPACGSGNTLLAFTIAFAEAGYDPQTQLHINAVDITPWCVHLTYSQLALMNIPAVVTLGNSKTGVMTERWYTPAHIHYKWTERLLNQSQP